MTRYISVLFIGLCTLNLSCIEPFSFDVDNVEAPLVIEAYISDVSYKETINYPSDGRYFKVNLRYGQRILSKGQTVKDAVVTLISEKGDRWLYSAVQNKLGTYILSDPNFKAVAGIKYKLHILLTNGEEFESEWVGFDPTFRPMGNISFIETERYENEFRAGQEKPVVRLKKGINLTVEIPENLVEKTYYKWEYDATWIYIAGKLPPRHPNYRCWVRSNGTYLSQYSIAEINTGRFSQELVFISVESNFRVAEGLSVLVSQQIISKEHYNFLSELEEQSLTGSIFSPPPYNLKTNYHHINGEKQVFGFFSVVHEEAKRFYFSEDDLSYSISNSTVEACRALPMTYPGDPCVNCLNYNYGGTPTLTKPFWWSY